MASLLIIDDDVRILELLSEFFSGRYACASEGSAEAALSRLSSEHFDVVVTDVSMPGLSGEDLLGFLKAHSPATPVIVISGSTDREDADRLLVKGAFAYLRKPFNLEEIEGAVERGVEYRRRYSPGVPSR